MKKLGPPSDAGRKKSSRNRVKGRSHPKMKSNEKKRFAESRGARLLDYTRKRPMKGILLYKGEWSTSKGRSCRTPPNGGKSIGGKETSWRRKNRCRPGAQKKNLTERKRFEGLKIRNHREAAMWLEE